MPICVECEWFHEIPVDTCDNRDLPITEFIHGHRDCYRLNSKGDCKGFKPQAKPQPYSIYDAKEEEDLANPIKED